MSSGTEVTALSQVESIDGYPAYEVGEYVENGEVSIVIDEKTDEVFVVAECQDGEEPYFRYMATVGHNGVDSLASQLEDDYTVLFDYGIDSYVVARYE